MNQIQLGIMKEDNNKKVAAQIYKLLASSLIFGFPFGLAIIVYYRNRNAVRGTWLESHFKWQKRTIVLFVFMPLILMATITTRIKVGVIAIIFAIFWFIYRICKGWIYLAMDKEICS